jgi:hydroxyacylglutathione hydrolase
MITTINFGGVNAYLIKTDSCFILIDTGFPAKRAYLENVLKNSGCEPGDLKLIILTHGDHDHAGNCVYLRKKYGAKIAMHPDDSLIVEQGNMKLNRKDKPDKISIMFRAIILISFIFKPGKFETFMPDFYIDENFNFSPFRFDAKVIRVPGHSKGSIGILAIDGSFFCGDFLYNFFGNPKIEFCDDLTDFNSNVQKLKRHKIKVFYPGHGKAFTMEQFLKKY